MTHMCTLAHSASRLYMCTQIVKTVQMYIILQVFRGSSCKVLPRKFILYSVPSVYAKHFKWQCVIYPDIIAPSPMRGLQARDFHPSGFLFLCLRVSSLSQRPGPELAGVHWIPEHRPSLHIGRAGPLSWRIKIRNLHSLCHPRDKATHYSHNIDVQLSRRQFSQWICCHFCGMD